MVNRRQFNTINNCPQYRRLFSAFVYCLLLAGTLAAQVTPQVRVTAGDSTAVSAREETGRWGWNVHRFINYHAADYLPEVTGFFEKSNDFLNDHATDPDQDSQPGYYHYIDIDYYSEFFTGELPHDWDEMVARYGLEIMIQNGTIPWVIETWTDSLTGLMAAGKWDSARQVAAELGHYVADSHEPLHLTLNYNGQLSGNDGIHSRYETTMMDRYLSTAMLPDSIGVLWENLSDSVFDYIEDLYPFVADILAADNIASSANPSYNDAYYASLWSALDSLTTIAVQRAILDLASIWYTAWVDAGRPIPGGGQNSTAEQSMMTHFNLDQNVPNPFNSSTTLYFDLPVDVAVRLVIYDIMGREVARLTDRQYAAGNHTVIWNGTETLGWPVPSGLYIARLMTPEFTKSIKMLLLK